MPRPTGQQLKDGLAKEGLSLIAELCPGGKLEAGSIWSCPNPGRSKDDVGSFKVWVSPGAFGAWKEYDEGDESKGDLIALIALAKRLTVAQALEWAAQRLGLDHGPPPTPAQLAAEKARHERRNMEEERKRARNRDRAFELWRKATPVMMDDRDGATAVVRQYLASRGIDLAEIFNLEDREMRGGIVEHWKTMEFDERGHKARPGHRGPCMLVPFRDQLGVVTGVHCTWVTPTGKMNLPDPKLVRGTVQGSVLRLTKGEYGLNVEDMPKAFTDKGLQDGVMIGEGIETTLSRSIRYPNLRAWAAGFLGNIGFAPVHPDWVQFVLLLQDNDPSLKVEMAFNRQADRLEDLLYKTDRRLVIERPKQGKDFNDQLQGKGEWHRENPMWIGATKI